MTRIVNHQSRQYKLHMNDILEPLNAVYVTCICREMLTFCIVYLSDLNLHALVLFVVFFACMLINLNFVVSYVIDFPSVVW